MSDHSNSTGSSGSSTNSWTLLSPEEVAVENVGPVDDGTESLGDVPSLSEEATGAAVEFKPSDLSIEAVLSEEGHQKGFSIPSDLQVCQETCPESSEGPIPSNLDLSVESQPPVIHDIVTTSPSDNELLEATPSVTNISLGVPLDVPSSLLPPVEPEQPSVFPVSSEGPVVAEQPSLFHSSPAAAAEESPVDSAGSGVGITTETLAAVGAAAAHADADVAVAPERTEASSPADDLPAPELVGSQETEEETPGEKEEMEQAEIPDEMEDEEEDEEGPFSGFDDGLRRRNIPSFEAANLRRSDEEDEEEEEEEVEFKLAEKKKEEKSWFSLNKCIVGALVLLFLGSLFLSGDFDDSESSDAEQSEDWLVGDPQDMKMLLDKLTQENQQIAQLESQLQSQKEQLDLALKAVATSGDETGKADLEKENANLRKELLFLPELKTELESLRARVTELSQLIDDQQTPPSNPSPVPRTEEREGPGAETRDKNKEGRLKEELKRQKVLLDESRKRLEGMIEDGSDRKRVRDHLEEIQKELSKKVEKWSAKKQREPKGKGYKGKSHQQDNWRKDDKKKRKSEKDKQSREEEWKGKEDKKKEQRAQKENSHKEAWRKHQAEWERKKGERRKEREERRKEKPWHSRPGKNPPQEHHQHRRQQQHNHNDFWRDQEQKLRRILRPLGCTSVEQCAAQEGLYPVELPEFEELLEGYLSKLEGSSPDSRDKIHRLTADFFQDGVFVHDKVLFSGFAANVADILEDAVDVLERGGKKKDDSLEEEMEEFEREALWKFAATA
ncbi:pre-B-cell leukemia transcription factor-interacting protein 1 isoform X2 [Takifugu rubripes]|uniref:pre-B-cell leukemia transcription factor-interacting protein 1 isoform X2 n=1 Tax=Takifugu rubripes TaxID=31033 RepID=UPI001145849B|nr:pre-B-cell leukemia transcription factor-interacting protein 1-like isoform X2 [Takifugu rubripes]